MGSQKWAVKPFLGVPSSLIVQFQSVQSYAFEFVWISRKPEQDFMYPILGDLDHG